jgi:hypothetical protein
MILLEYSIDKTQWHSVKTSDEDEAWHNIAQYHEDHDIVKYGLMQGLIYEANGLHYRKRKLPGLILNLR